MYVHSLLLVERIIKEIIDTGKLPENPGTIWNCIFETLSTNKTLMQGYDTLLAKCGVGTNNSLEKVLVAIQYDIQINHTYLNENFLLIQSTPKTLQQASNFIFSCICNSLT